MRVHKVLLATACVAFSCTTIWGDDAPASLQVYPAQISLQGPRASQQISVSGSFGDKDVRDLTSTVEYTSSNEAIARVDAGRVLAVADGEVTITAKHGEVTSVVSVAVTGTGTQRQVSFKNETLAALTKSGCNMGACHGSPSGKAGFRLSLRGYDPPLDLLTLRGEYQGRRSNPMEPDESLILMKPLMEVSHAGGKRLSKGDPSHQVLRQWIAEGLQTDAPTEPDLVSIEVFPRHRIFLDKGDRQQLVVTGTFSDGSHRDLTDLTVFSSSAESVGSVSEQGLVKKVGRGETAILARYLDKMDTSNITFLEQVPGFEWTEPEADNFVDRLVNEKLRHLQIAPSELCTDEEFVRRAYLDLAGRLPTLAETNAFLAMGANRRSQTVDHLLNSTDHAAFWSLKWADVLRVNSNKLKSPGVHKLVQWIYEGVLRDQPMDEFARELLTARGSVFENPAANYWRASREPTDAVETTAQLFLGVRIQCAKCHNHPFERWTQDNYYGVAAALLVWAARTAPFPMKK